MKGAEAMIDLLACETRIADHYQRASVVNTEGWKKTPRIPRYRVTLAQMLIALAVRIAPTVTYPSPSTRVLAR
jgi:hypothetical protein